MFWDLIVFLILCLCTIYISCFYLLTIFEKRKKFFAEPVINKFYNISFIIPAYNEGSSIKKTLHHILSLEWEKNIEIIVVDDGSSDNTVEEASSVEGVIVFSKKHGGKAAAVNYGVKRASYDFVAIVDADSFPRPDALLRAMPYFEDSNVAAVSSSILVHKPRNFVEKIQVFEYLATNCLRKANCLLDALYITPGALSIFRKKALFEVGLFDTSTLTEDLDIACNLLYHKYKVRNAPAAVSYTIVPSSLSGLVKQRIRWARGALVAAKKYSKIFFNREYSTFGMFVFPSLFLVFVLAVYFTFNIFSMVLNSPILHLSVFNFFSRDLLDVWVLNMSVFNYLFLITTELVFIVLIIVLSTFHIFIGARLVREKVSPIHYPFSIFYLVIWGVFMGVIYFISFAVELLKVPKKW